MTPASPTPASLDMIRRLVAFDTVSRHSNLAFIDFVRDLLEEHGITARLIHDSTGHKANLMATIGPAEAPGVVLSGHTDVVPVDGQNWDADPFTVVERAGRLYGRGTADMKSFLAVALALVPEFQAAGLRRPVHLAFSYDEEVGCRGAPDLARALAALPVRPEACIVGEPTEMQVIRGHKGKYSYHCTVEGRECHSSLTDQGVNAVQYAAELVTRIAAAAERCRIEGPHDPAFEPGWSTLHVGTIQGGTALNIVPRHCAFEFEIRNLPGHDGHALFESLRREAEHELLPRMQAVAPEAEIRFEERTGIPGFEADEEGEVSTLAKALAGRNDSRKVGFATEAGIFAAAGIPAIVCGPGSIAQAHRPNEFIALEQVAACERFLRRLMERLSR